MQNEEYELEQNEEEDDEPVDCITDKELVVKDLVAVINRHSLDAWCNCHDYNLADYLFETIDGIARLNHTEDLAEGNKVTWDEGLL